jgi:23S rRNA pseudouridine2605 synthase
MKKSSSPLGKVPLERALSKLGIASRTQTRLWIQQKRIRVNHKVIDQPLFLTIPEKDIIELDGKRLWRSTHKTIILYKPRGIVTTRSDEKGRPTIYSLLSSEDQSLHPVGRLDMATTGLLLLTNDSRFSSWLTDSKNRIPRVYVVTVKGCVTEEEKEKLESGIMDKGECLKAEKITLRKISQRESHLLIELLEGKNREIRRMLESFGHEVTSLKRISWGGIQLGTLQPGEIKMLTVEELRKIFPQAPLDNRS